MDSSIVSYCSTHASELQQYTNRIMMNIQDRRMILNDLNLRELTDYYTGLGLFYDGMLKDHKAQVYEMI